MYDELDYYGVVRHWTPIMTDVGELGWKPSEKIVRVEKIGSTSYNEHIIIILYKRSFGGSVIFLGGRTLRTLSTKFMKSTFAECKCTS